MFSISGHLSSLNLTLTDTNTASALPPQKIEQMSASDSSPLSEVRKNIDAAKTAINKLTSDYNDLESLLSMQREEIVNYTKTGSGRIPPTDLLNNDAIKEVVQAYTARLTEFNALRIELIKLANENESFSNITKLTYLHHASLLLKDLSALETRHQVPDLRKDRNLYQN
ncbi:MULTISPECIES: hypothetical protein [unclassified Pseudomonas]|uniref:hypothetical protein n=1 Tax=unclassified Pseudomonas TaxID=196821 RepID=UPI00117ADC09|nr:MULTISPECIES: hypothetical protein [unclassified Pseudomonas]